MDRWLLSFLLGSILALLPPKVPVLFYESLLTLLALAWFLLKNQRTAISFLLGMCWMFAHACSYQTIWQENGHVQPNFFYQSHQALINVVGLPKKTDKGWQFVGKVTVLDQQPLNRPFKVRLTWQHEEIALFGSEQLNAIVKLKPANGLANLGGFSYQTWLRSQNIAATGYIVPKKTVMVNASAQSWRVKAYHQVNKVLEGLTFKPLILALSFGDRTGFSNDIWQVLSQTGTQHLVAISGLHIGLIVSLSYLIAFGMLRILPLSRLIAFSSPSYQFIFRINWVYVASGFAVVTSMFYSYLAGFSIPTIRALIFFLMVIFSLVSGAKLCATRLVLWSVFITIIILPASLYSVSFWLSYLAVCAVMLIYWRYKYWLNRFYGVKKYLLTLVVIQLGLSICLLPVTAIIFNQYSFIAFFANLLALPVISFLVLPLILLAMVVCYFSPSIARLVFELADICLQQLWRYLTWLGDFDWAFSELSNHTILIFVLLGIFILAIALADAGRLKLKQKISFNAKPVLSIGIAVIALVSLSGFIRLPNSSWQVTTLDIGQGLAVVIAKNNKAIIYDTGNRYPSGWNLADSVVIPYLTYQGLVPDMLIISHNDSDHAGGIDSILNTYPDISLVYNQTHDNKFKNKNHNKHQGKQRSCLAGQRIHWQELTIEVLWPLEWLAEDNDDSCVLLISDGKNSALLTGDISKKVERKLIKRYPKLAADMLVAPHHGSKSSSSKSFIASVSPQYAVFSTGFLNRWRMPNADVVARYKRQGIQTFNTAENGMVSIEFSDNSPQISRYRQDIFPYWFAN